MRNIIIVIFIVLAIGGITYVRMNTLNVKIPAQMIGATFTVTYYTPETVAEPLSYEIDGDNMTVTLPDLQVWGVIHIAS